MARLAQQKKAFIDHFRQVGNVSVAARAAGVPRRTVYNWRKRSAEFAAAWLDAEEEAAERLEQALWDVAVPHPAEQVVTELLRGRDGLPLQHPGTQEDWYAITRITRTVEHDTLAIIALLKARCPERYRERVDVRHSGVVVHVNAAEALDEALTRVREWESSNELAGVASAPTLPPGELSQLSDDRQRHYLR